MGPRTEYLYSCSTPQQVPRSGLIRKSERRRATYGCATSPKGLLRQARRLRTPPAPRRQVAHSGALKRSRRLKCASIFYTNCCAPLGCRALVNCIPRDARLRQRICGILPHRVFCDEEWSLSVHKAAVRAYRPTAPPASPRDPPPHAKASERAAHISAQLGVSQVVISRNCTFMKLHPTIL